jgi:hypothetical protein
MDRLQPAPTHPESEKSTSTHNQNRQLTDKQIHEKLSASDDLDRLQLAATPCAEQDDQ